MYKVNILFCFKASARKTQTESITSHLGWPSDVGHDKLILGNAVAATLQTDSLHGKKKNI